MHYIYNMNSMPVSDQTQPVIAPNAKEVITPDSGFWSDSAMSKDESCVEDKAAKKAAAAEKLRGSMQTQSKHRIIMMMFLCPYESKSDRVLTEWLWKQTKDTVIDFFFMNDQEKNAYYTAHGPMHDSDAPEYTDEHAMYAMERQHDDYYWRDREVPSNVDYRRVSEKRVE